MTLAVLLDTTLVRVLLVPATMQLLGRHNGWTPHPFAFPRRVFGQASVPHKAREAAR